MSHSPVLLSRAVFNVLLAMNKLICTQFLFVPTVFNTQRLSWLLGSSSIKVCLITVSR